MIVIACGKLQNNNKIFMQKTYTLTLLGVVVVMGEQERRLRCRRLDLFMFMVGLSTFTVYDINIDSEGL